MRENHVSKEDFWNEFFGNFGREIGDPNAHFTDNPSVLPQFIADCTRNKKPAFISVNPRLEHDKIFGIEKLFFDFDSEDKNFVRDLQKQVDEKTITEEEKKKILDQRAIEVIGETKQFIDHLEALKLTPMIIRTKKGFHIHVYLSYVRALSTYDIELYKRAYELLQRKLIQDRRQEIMYKYFDTSVLGDVKRLCRIPLSIHQATGMECFFVKKIVKTQHGYDIIPDKIRGTAYFINYGLKDFEWAFGVAKRNLEAEEKIRLEKQAEQKNKWENHHGFVGRIRPCFIKALATGEMKHKQRLALETEAWFAGEFNGNNTKTEEGIINIFRAMHDFIEKKTRDQVHWFFEHQVPKFDRGLKPYSCDTIEENNWCIREECFLYNKRKTKNGQKS